MHAHSDSPLSWVKASECQDAQGTGEFCKHTLVFLRLRCKGENHKLCGQCCHTVTVALQVLLMAPASSWEAKLILTEHKNK